MDREIAVICASPPGINPGMDSVDLAFLYLTEKYKLRDRTQFWLLYSANKPTQTDSGEGKISYSIIPFDKEFFETKKVILYWGDFLHMRQYHESVCRKLVMSGLSDSLESAEKRVQSVFLQADQRVEVLGKTLTFGSALVFNTIRDETDLAYSTSLERFLKFCKASWFRDVYSAFKACQAQGEFQSNHLGVDCSILIDPIVTQSVKKKPIVEDVVGIFIGRSSENIEAMIRFASDVAKALSCRLVWLRWGDPNAFPALSSIFRLDSIRSLDSFSEEPMYQVEDALGQLLRCRAIVTDTYHVNVNSWNLGVPAICLVENKFSQNKNVNFGDYFAPRDKRQIFMSMYDALDFLVDAEELENAERRDARVSHLADLIYSGKVVTSIQKRIRSHSESAEAQLIQGLLSLL